MTKDIQYLYLHVPFCKSICNYCDFAHTVYQKENADLWLDALAKEMDYTKIQTNLKTIYIGGGTPTALSYEQLERLLTLLDSYCTMVEEYTVEVNPETLDLQKAELLARHHVNRISMGFQSSNPKLLNLMGRHHTKDTIQEAITLFHQVGIQNISLDLMYSLPTQTMDDLKQSVEDALSYQPKHLSLYSLTIEENSVFGKKGYHNLDEDTEADMYEWICARLQQAGYHQYEISNFSLEGYESKHNLAYWHYEDFYGISLGASGKEGLCRYEHTRNFKKYLANPMEVEEIHLSQNDAMFEMVMMGLRLKKGISYQDFFDRFGKNYMDVFGKNTKILMEKGLLVQDGESIRASERGYEILNSVLVDLMDI